MRAKFVLTCVALMAVAATADAKIPVQQPTANVPAQVTKAKGDPNRMVCRTLPTTGSRLKPNRDCRTAQQWMDAQANDRRDIDRLQANRYSGNQ